MAHVFPWFPRSIAAFALGVSLSTATAAHATTIVINNLDGVGEGFNATSARSPVGGNPGTTLGAQRLNAFQEAANRWAAVISSSVTIEVDSNFDPLLPCDGTNGALLGMAGPNTVFRDFAGAPLAGTWYSKAQADSLAGIDLAPGTADIGATFSSNIDLGCLPGVTGWYYGFDGNPPAGQLDLVPTLLHELAHGLGFLTLTDLASGAKLLGFDDIFMSFLENHSTGLTYPAMSNAQRVAASINTGNLHWVGANVAAASSLLSAGKTGTHVQMYAPNPQEGGSSVSHFSTTLTPNELMEPFDTGTSFQGITEAAFVDMGWTVVAVPTPTPTPVPSPTCAVAPIGGCRTPSASGKAFVMVKDKAPDDAKDLLLWKWLKGSLTTKAEFGSPLFNTSYQLCVYDGTSNRILDAAIPAGGLCNLSRPKPCWADVKHGFNYKNKDLTPDGIEQLKLREGLSDGKAQITLKGKGLLLDDPAIPVSQPVTVQLLSGSGVCWQAVYSAPAIKNTLGPPGLFKDKAD